MGNEPIGLFGIALELVCAFGAVWFSRNLTNKDKDHEKWRADMEARMSKVQDHQVDQDLAAKDLVSRNELNGTVDKVFAEIKGLRQDMAGEFKDFQSSVLSALGHRGGQ